MRQIPFLFLTATALLAGCPDREVSELTPAPAKVEYKDIPVTVNRDLDLLFVIDNSGSMGEEQDSLKANFPKFINVLNTIQGGLPNAHIAVVNSDMGTLGGPRQGTPGDSGCDGNGDDGVMRALETRFTNGMANVRYISDIKDDATGNRIQNYTGSLAEVFSEQAAVKNKGCGYEMHLNAMRRALDNPANAGFLRPNAYLAVIIIADEDDCSLKTGAGQGFFSQGDIANVQSFRCFSSSTTCDGNLGDQVGPRANCRPNDNSQYHEKISTYVDFLKSKKSDPGLLIVAGILGNPTPVSVTTRVRNNVTVPDLVPSCTYQGATLQRAFPAVRTAAFLKAFPQTTFTTICKQDLSDGLVQIAQLLKTIIGSPCIDSDLATPYQCAVSDVTNPGKPNQTEVRIPQCDQAHSVKPCWTLDADVAKCAATKSQLALNIDRGGTVPAANTHVIANCVTK
ncbi:MAG TPA: VWA domain-containing protein [Kofleriaceae bacterium]|nr:VWA domain-containing protein [Kofleriaceae bacterium]